MPRPHIRGRGGTAQACSTRMREHRVTLATFELRTSLSNYTFHGSRFVNEFQQEEFQCNGRPDRPRTNPAPFTPEQLAWLQGKFGQQPANPEPTGPNPAATATNAGAPGAALPDGGELIR